MHGVLYRSRDGRARGCWRNAATHANCNAGGGCSSSRQRLFCFRRESRFCVYMTALMTLSGWTTPPFATYGNLRTRTSHHTHTVSVRMSSRCAVPSSRSPVGFASSFDGSIDPCLRHPSSVSCRFRLQSVRIARLPRSPRRQGAAPLRRPVVQWMQADLRLFDLCPQTAVCGELSLGRWNTGETGRMRRGELMAIRHPDGPFDRVSLQGTQSLCQ